MAEKGFINRKFFYFLVSSVILLLLAFSIPRIFILYYSPHQITKRFQKDIFRSEKDLTEILGQVMVTPGLENENAWGTVYEKQKSFLQKKDITLLAFEKDSLVFWSNNVFPSASRLDSGLISHKTLERSNGVYLLDFRQRGNLTIVALLLVYNHYMYQNDYVSSGFTDRFHVPGNVALLFNKGGIPVYRSTGEKIFSLNIHTIPKPKEWLIVLVFILFIAGILFLNAAVFRGYVIFNRVFKSRWLLLIAFAFDTVILRAIVQFVRIPAFLYNSDFFNPLLYADSEFLPSLGDFVISGFLVLQLFYYFVKYSPAIRSNDPDSPVKSRAIAIAFNLIPALGFFVLSQLMSSLVKNSDIPFSFNNILDFSYFSFASAVILSCLLISFLFVFEYSAKNAFIFYTNKKVYLLDAGIIVLIYLVVLLIQKKFLPDFVCPVLLFGCYLKYYFNRKKMAGTGFRFNNVAVFLFILALMATHELHSFSSIKENGKRRILAENLTDTRDRLAEYFFKNMESDIAKNDNIQKMAENVNHVKENQEALIGYILKKYFSGYWSKYHIQTTLCTEGKRLAIKPGNYIIGCNEYFENLINKNGKPTSAKGLYFISTNIDQRYYLGKIALNGLQNAAFKAMVLYIEISSPVTAKGLGYPELLLDKSQMQTDNLTDYSYAIYRSDELIKNVGEYNYSQNLNSYRIKGSNTFFDSNGYNHFIIKVDAFTTVMVSKKLEGFMGYIAPLSFFFLFLSLFFFLFMRAAGGQIRLGLSNISFTLRLQISSVSVLLFSMLLVGGLSLFFVNRLNRSKNDQLVKEKAHSVLIEMEQRLSNVNHLKPGDSEGLSDELLKLSQVYFSDINIFTPDGRLLASSRRKVFDEGLLSQQINPEALHQLTDLRKVFYIHNEKIAKYTFLSAYVPFRNNDNALLGFINLPYFARQNELKLEISTFVSAFSNIYILLTALAVFSSLWIARYITHPLQLIREKLHHVQLGKKNAKIEWSGHDEIGDLIEEYNRMVDELARRAVRLAQSERELAWRQMARQVAHEIKNPLTPMKLSMQLLMRAWEDKAPDWDERLKRFSQTIILQIDTLTSIASEFSDFAQMPATKFEKIDIVEILNVSSALFKDFESITIRTNAPEKEFYVRADEKQMLRVFNNLIKNSVQAISGKSGEIDVSFEKRQSVCIIEFKDNGSGIQQEKHARIFTPDFTTKSGGMGLGLAMVKSIIDNSGGDIRFESTESRGTTFYITMPLYTDTEIAE